MSVAQRPCTEKAYIRCHGAEYTEMPEAFPIRECGQFGPHAGLEQVESIGYAASEDYHMRIESIHYNLHKPADIHPELIHKTDSIGLSGSSIFFCIFARNTSIAAGNNEMTIMASNKIFKFFCTKGRSPKK